MASLEQRIIGMLYYLDESIKKEKGLYAIIGQFNKVFI